MTHYYSHKTYLLHANNYDLKRILFINYQIQFLFSYINTVADHNFLGKQTVLLDSQSKCIVCCYVIQCTVLNFNEDPIYLLVIKIDLLYLYYLSCLPI